MVGPSSQISKFLLTLLFLIVIYFMFMDYSLYVRIQYYSLDGTNYSDVTWVNCNINPLCDVTVKALLLDHLNYYVFAPLVTIVDNSIHISQINFITPNGISFFHVFVAVLAAKCVSSSNLSYRRVGVALFELRTWLDDLDGHVARVRKHIKGERSEVGSSGYYIDGLCDALGCTALVVGILVFFRNNPPRRGYMQLPINETNDAYCTKVQLKNVLKKLIMLTIQLILSSAAWNRYIDLYQELLEDDGGLLPRQQQVFKAGLFYFVCFLWRVVNIHNIIHLLLLSIFCDKLWDFLSYVQYLGFGVLITVICTTELYYNEARNYVFENVE